MKVCCCCRSYAIFGCSVWLTESKLPRSFMHWCLFSYRIGKNITNISTKKGLSRFVKKRRLASLMSRFPPLPLASILLPGWPAPAPPRRNCVDPPVAAHVTINVTVFPAIHVLHSFRTLRLPPLSKIYRFNVKSFLLFTIACSRNTYIPFSQQPCCTEPDACDSKKRLNDDVSVWMKSVSWTMAPSSLLLQLCVVFGSSSRM